MQQVLLTGSRGWFGGLLLPRLRARGVEVRCAHHETPADQIAAEAAAADVVVHSGGAYSNRREELVEANLEQTIAVARGCEKARNAVVFLSSVKLYGWDAAGGSCRGESDPVSPTAGDHYAAAKRLGEDLVAAAAHRSVILRVANAYGRPTPSKYIVGGMFDTFHRTRAVRLACTGASRRDFVDVADVVRVLESVTLDLLGGEPRTAAANVPGGCEVYNVASGRLITLMRVAELFRETLGARIEVADGPATSSPQFDNSKVIAHGHIDAFRDPVEGLRDALAYYRKPALPSAAGTRQQIQSMFGLPPANGVLPVEQDPWDVPPLPSLAAELPVAGQLAP